MATNTEMNSSATENKPSSTERPTPAPASDLSNPFRLENSDSPGTVLVTELMTAHNYSTWSRALQQAL